MPRRRASATVPVVLVLLFALAACGDGGGGGPAADGTPAPAEAEGGYVTGRVTGADGKPVSAPGAAVTVSIEGVSEKSGERVQYTADVKPDGTYRQKVVEGSYRVSRASVALEHEGKNWAFHDLEPVPLVRGDRSSEEGITQDFVWKLQGKRPGSDGNVNNHTHWYGQEVNLNWALYREDLKKGATAPPAGTTFTFTLTPKGTRIDGAPAETVVVERAWDPDRGIDSLNDLPLASYDLTGTATLPDGTTEPVVFEVEYAKYAPVLPVRFTPGSSGGPIHSFGLASAR